MFKADVGIFCATLLHIFPCLYVYICNLNASRYTCINTNLLQVVLSEYSSIVLVDVLLLPVLQEENICGLVSIFWGCLQTCIPHRANPLSYRARLSMPNTVGNHKALSVMSLITLESLCQNHLTSVILPLWLITFTGGCCLSQLFRKKCLYFVVEE